jgi:predicted tellurium resistance membrane protein TerC
MSSSYTQSCVLRDWRFGAGEAALLQSLLTSEGWAALSILGMMEVFLSIDNIVAMAAVVALLPKERARAALLFGLLAALALRALFQLWLASAAGWTALFPLFPAAAVSWGSVILFASGVFLILKAVHEFHLQIENTAPSEPVSTAHSFGGAVAQIVLVTIAFSFDSSLTAIGLTDDAGVMLIGVLISVALVFFAAEAIAGFVNAYPTTKIVAMALLVPIGFSMILSAVGVPVPKVALYLIIAIAGLAELGFLVAFRGRRKIRKAKRPPELARRKVQ